MTEKEIIKQIKNDLNVGEFYGITEDSIKGLLDLYNKQKEEIQKLKQANEVFKRYTVDCRELEIEINNGWEDKIREKIKEIENGTYDAKIVLKQLLKE